jgi:heptose I phosphotransferase
VADRPDPQERATFVVNGFSRSSADPDVVIADDARDLVAELGLDRLERAFELVPLRATAHKAIARLDCSRGAVYVKRYDFDRLEVFVKAFLKANFPVFSGPRELENVLALRAAGIAAPRPLAAGERDEGRRRRSFVVLEAIPGTPLEELELPPERRDLVRRVARLVRDLHAAGFWHKDLYLANLLWDGATLGLVDCERVKRRQGGPPPRARARDLASLDYSAERFSATDRVRFLREYLGLERLDDAAKALARVARSHARKIARRGKKG